MVQHDDPIMTMCNGKHPLLHAALLNTMITVDVVRNDGD
jgi:hypothetical protein